MYLTTRRGFVIGGAAAATMLGLNRPVEFLVSASAQGAGATFKSYKVGEIAMTSIYDGVIDRPHDPAFVKNASLDDVKASLKAGGISDASVPNPFVVPMARIGGKTVLFDAGTGGQLAPTAGSLAANLTAAGRDPASVDVVLVSHFHPDHIFGLMAKDTNAPLFPKAEIVMPEVEYNWWTDAGVLAKLPPARQGLAKRVQAVFPDWKSKGRIRLVGDNAEVVPGVRSIHAPGHTPGHMAWHVTSGASQLFVLADTVTYNPVFLRNPGWHAAFDADGALAEANRRKLIERAIAEKAMVTAYHFIFPSAGTIARDGNGYRFEPIA